MSHGAGVSTADAYQYQALHTAELERLQRRREDRRQAHEAANAPVPQAFRGFAVAAGRTASYAAISVVRESDFLPHLDRVDELLAETQGADLTLTLDERGRLLAACTAFASAQATGNEIAAHPDFRAAVDSVRDSVQQRTAATSSTRAGR